MFQNVFPRKKKKCDALALAQELEIEIDEDATEMNLIMLITKRDKCEEEFVKTLLDAIISNRKENEAR